MTEEESPTRYMLPEQAEGAVDYSLNEYSPAKYPTFNKHKKRKKKNKDKDKKTKPGKSVQFHAKVTLITIYRTLKNQIEEIDLANEEGYPSRVSAFALKRTSQQQILKYQNQYRPFTPRRQLMLKHIRETLLRENGNQSSSVSTAQTLPKTSTQTLSYRPSPS